MAAVALALALLTSVAYGLSNYVGPRLARGASVYVLLIVGQGCSLVLAAAVVAEQGAAFPGKAAVVAALIAGLGNASGLVLFYRAAAIGPLSIITPVAALGATLPIVYGLSRGEALTALKGAGIVLALGGLFLVARRQAADQAPGGPRVRAILVAGASAVGFGVFLAAMAPASEDGVAWAIVLSRASLLVALIGFALVTRQELRTAAARLPLLAVPGLLLFAGTLAYAVATREGDLSVVSVAGSLFPVVTVSLAVLLDGERLSRSQAAGVVATLAGVLALSAR